MQARADGMPITIEVCPHHLLYTGDSVPEGATEYKCAPPLRDRGNLAALRAATGAGTIGSIASDHSPIVPEERYLQEGDFLQAWGGIGGVQYLLAAANTVARVRKTCCCSLACMRVCGKMLERCAPLLLSASRKAFALCSASQSLRDIRVQAAVS